MDPAARNALEDYGEGRFEGYDEVYGDQGVEGCGLSCGAREAVEDE